MSNQDARAAGERVEALLAELRSSAGPQVAATAEELVSCLVELYGAGLAEIVSIIGEDTETDGSGRRLLARLAADPLVESLLLVHDLHPVDAGTRIRRAIGRVMPQLGPHAGQVEYRGIDDDGVVRLRLERGAHGCGSSATSVQAALENAVLEAAPETAGVDVEVVAAPKELPLLQITRGPSASAAVEGAR
jgi:Fe-S cluster biogenesis protein NfuA